MGEFKPSKYQQAVFDFIQNGKGSAIVEAVAGGGKCLGINTPIMLFDGSAKPVQEIVIGDLLMGPDSKPRKVLSTNRGYGNLFQINPIKGDSWVCNDVHILTLKGTNRKADEVRDVPLNELIEETKHLPRLDRDWKLFRVPVEFEKQEINIEPYLLGLWLGDGSKSGPIITNPEPEIKEYLQNQAEVLGLECKEVRQPSEKCPSYSLTNENFSGKKNILRDFLKTSCVVNDEKRIPKTYLTSDVKDRLDLLAGLIDTDGYVGVGCAEIITKYVGLRDDILFLARSLGFAAYSSIKKVQLQEWDSEREYQRIKISGSLIRIPCKVERKKTKPRKQIKDVLKTGFEAIAIGEGDYYGFTLDQDGRFLLGDFTVTHNTSTIVEALKLIPDNKQTIFLAFNKSIKEELQKRVPRGVRCSTFHAICWGALQRTEYKGFKTDTSKTNKILKEEMAFQFDPKVIKRLSPQVNRLVALAKSVGIAPAGSDLEGLVPDTKDNWEELINHHGLIFDDSVDKDNAIKISQSVLQISITKRDVLDFDDYLYICALDRIPFYTNDLVFVDEAQDVSQIQRAILTKVLKRNGRIIAVGDSFQAVYGFRGSDSESLNNIAKQFNAERLPLSISYRCPKAVVEEAQKYVGHIESHESAPDGFVAELGEYKADMFKEKDMVVCRNTAPIIRCAYYLISNKVPVTVLGKDLGAGFIKLIEKLNPRSIDNLKDKLDSWFKKERNRMLKKDPEADLSALDDRYQAISMFMEHSGARTVDELISAINNLFKSKNGGVILCTIHKSKGLEAKRVFFLDPFLLPSKYARKAWQQQQETNLAYVAITRAQEFLGYISSPRKD